MRQGMSRYAGSERRTGSEEDWYNRCRLCWRPLSFDAKCVEFTATLAFYRCPECGGSFPIRRADLAKWGIEESPTNEAVSSDE